MNEREYPITSGRLVVKYGVYGTDKYFVKDMESKKSGLANEDLKNLLMLCDGTKNIKEIIDYITKTYNEPKEVVIKKVKKSIQYLKKMGYIELTKKSDSRPIIFHENDLSLDMVYIEVTNRCNLSCFHCYASANQNQIDEMDTKTIFRLIDELSELGVIEIIITGGEPLLRNDIFEIMQYIADKNISFVLFTNGVLLDENKIKRLKKLKVEMVAVSLDSSDPDVHNRVRGKDCFSKVIKNIDLMIKEGIPVRINVSLFKGINDTKKQIGDMIEFLANKNIPRIVMGNLITYGRGKKQKNFVPPVYVAKIVSNTFKEKTKNFKASGKKMPVLAFTDEFKSGVANNEASLHSYCGVGTFACLIRPNGDVAPCPVFIDNKYISGNVLNKSIKEIWLNSKVFNNIFRNHNVDDIPDCKVCSSKYSCLGGCKARSVMYNGKTDSPDLWMCSIHGLKVGVTK